MANCFRNFISTIKNSIRDHNSHPPQTETSATTNISSASGKSLFAVGISGETRLCAVSYPSSATLWQTNTDAEPQIAASSQDGEAGPTSSPSPQRSGVGANSGGQQHVKVGTQRDETLSTLQGATDDDDGQGDETWSLSYASPRSFASTDASWTSLPAPLSSAATSVSGSSTGRISKPHGHPDRQAWVSPSRRSSSTTASDLQSVSPSETSPSRLRGTRKGHGHPHRCGVADFEKIGFSRDELE